MTTVTEQADRPHPEDSPSSGQLEPRHRAETETRTDPDPDYRGRHVTPSWWRYFSRKRER